MSLSSEVARKTAAASKRGAFGSASDRFAAAAAGTSSSGADTALAAIAGGTAAAVGPGQYQVNSGIARSVAAAAVRPSPVSASNVMLVHTFTAN